MSALAASPPTGAAETVQPFSLKFRLGLALGGLVFGAAGAYLVSGGSLTSVLSLCVVFVPVAIWKRPYLGPAVLLAAAILVEQSGQIPPIPITGNLPLFAGIGPGHLQGADILLLTVVFTYVVKSAEWGPRWWPRTHVAYAMLGVMGAVVLAVAVGQLHHGSLRIAFMEARPYVYLASSYFLTAVLVRNRRAIRAVLWAFVGSVGFKAFQGIYVWFENRHLYPKPEAYIGHEASYFFVAFMVLVPALWLFGQKGRLRNVATWLLPVVIWANLVNDRRASWEMLGGALLCFGVIVYQAMPIRRRLLGKAIVILILISAVYFPVMWNSQSSLGQPARAVKSQVKPSARDDSSDTYRIQENANLELNIKQSAPLGTGFGTKIDYALPIDDISTLDPLIAYIPHNDVLDVIMRMGLLGGIAMWFLIGAGIIAGSRLARNGDRELAVIGALAASSLVAYALMGGVDQGFFFYRLAFITGTLLGLAEAARRMIGSPTSPSPPPRVRAVSR